MQVKLLQQLQQQVSRGMKGETWSQRMTDTVNGVLLTLPPKKVSTLQQQLDAQAQEHRNLEEFRDEELRSAHDKIAGLVQQVSGVCGLYPVLHVLYLRGR